VIFRSRKIVKVIKSVCYDYIKKKSYIIQIKETIVTKTVVVI